MNKKVIAILLIVFIALDATACGHMKATRYEAEFLRLFDTLTRVVAYAYSKDEFTRQVQIVHDSLEQYHELYDIYNDYEGINNLKTVNDNAGIAPVKVDVRIIELIEYAREWYEKTDGRINIAFGAVLRIWHDYRTAGMEDPEAAELPPLKDLQEAAGHVDFDKVIIDKAGSTVFLEDPDMSLDVGAIAKGYAVEQVGKIAVENGFTSGLISVGGNVRAIGSKEGSGRPWNVGIQNPDSGAKQQDIRIVNLIDQSLVTSGIYERYYTVNGKNYHHIIDPQTLYPTEYYSAVTIISEDSGMADALSTAVFNMPFEKGSEFVESLDGVEALWVLKNNELRYSSHFSDFIKE